jgi:hypothetical protein
LQYIDWFYATFIKLQLVANVKPVTKYNEWYVCTLLDSMVTLRRCDILDLVGERHLGPEAEAKIAMKRQ